MIAGDQRSAQGGMNMTERKPVTEADIEVMARMARLDLPAARRALQAETMNGIFQMLDALDDGNLGETAPAFAFRARWEDAS